MSPSVHHEHSVAHSAHRISYIRLRKNALRNNLWWSTTRWVPYRRYA